VGYTWLKKRCGRDAFLGNYFLYGLYDEFQRLTVVGIVRDEFLFGAPAAIKLPLMS
jgi:hypothetical protein